MSIPIGSMYAIYVNMDPINIPPVMLAYIPAPWILWANTVYIAPTSHRIPWNHRGGIILARAIQRAILASGNRHDYIIDIHV